MVAKVIVGMSGGVDSSLAAALLIERGFDVTGVYMRNWSVDLPGFKCPWAEDLADAERVAVQLGIDLEVWDYEEEYKRDVVDYLVDCYARGLTPNPDVMCNEKVKFGVFAREAFERGADYIATGHYARVLLDAPGARCAHLLRALDEHKDQTYFLWRVPGSVLARTLFPIGEIESKAVVREMAAERGLEVATKHDYDGICFIGPVSIQQFLLSQLERKAGDIVEYETGTVLGRHEGAFLYTLGQRKGLDLGGGPARYVVKTDTADNVVYVSADKECEALWTTYAGFRVACPHPGAIWCARDIPVRSSRRASRRQTMRNRPRRGTAWRVLSSTSACRPWLPASRSPSTATRSASAAASSAPDQANQTKAPRRLSFGFMCCCDVPFDTVPIAHLALCYIPGRLLNIT